MVLQRSPDSIPKFGAWNQIKEPWYVQLLFPIIRSSRPESELHSLTTKNDYDPSIDYKLLTDKE
ncbi:MAG: hypothetical protein IPP49_20880 [Saprospiraceae bacterium]|nr:hypothetical protein [Saprospiraceae bacterium]